MPADPDDILARAERATECPRPTKTRGELMVELASRLDELDELEERWPDGEPEAWLEELRFLTIRLEIRNLRRELEDGYYAADARPHLAAIPGGRDDA